MNIRVRYFAHLRELLQKEEENLELQSGASVASLFETIFSHSNSPQFKSSLLVAINGEYASFSSPLQDDDEVVFIPPVAGG